MEELFGPVVKEVLRLVRQQVDNALKIKGKNINVSLSQVSSPDKHQRLRLADTTQLIVLIGGFGNSDFLKQAIDAFCASTDAMRCIRPDFWQAELLFIPSD